MATLGLRHAGILNGSRVRRRQLTKATNFQSSSSSSLGHPER